MPAGRPSTYDPSYCDRVIEMGRSGMSVVEMCAELGCARSTLEAAWPEAYPEFSEALGLSRVIAQAWWETQGRHNLTADKFQASLYSRSMAARFPHDWREKTVHSNDPENPMPSAVSLDVSKLSPEALREIAGLSS